MIKLPICSAENKKCKRLFKICALLLQEKADMIEISGEYRTKGDPTMNNRGYRHFGKKTVAVWKSALSLLLALTLLPAAPSYVFATEQAQTQYFVNEDYEQEITEPLEHATPSVGEWKAGQTTAEIVYQGGRVYLNKKNSGSSAADMMIPLSKGYVNGGEPASKGTPVTDIYIEFNWRAYGSSTRLYLRGVDASGKAVNLFYFTQAGNKLRYSKSDNSSQVSSNLDMKQTEQHDIRLFFRKQGDTYSLAKAWIDGTFDKNVNLTASAACEGLYSLVVDERRTSGTGLGSSFGSLKVWQPAEEQLRAILAAEPSDLTFDDIRGNNTEQNAITEDLVLTTGQILANGLTVVDWESSDEVLVSKTGVVTRPAEADQSVELRPVLSIYDVIGDGSADFVPVNVTAPGNSISITVRSKQLDEVKEKLSFEQIRGNNIDADHVNSDLVLISQMNGVEIAWQVKSITPEGTQAAVDVTTGSVRRPAKTEQDVLVVLTAVLTRGEEREEKDISFTVKKMEMDDAEYLQQLMQNLSFEIIAGENVSEHQVYTDLNLADKFGGAELVWNSSNPKIIAEDGTVHCPVYPETATEVILTVSATLNGVGPLKKEFRVTVLQGDAENLAKNADIKTNISGISADSLENIRDNNMQTFVEISARTKEFYITIDMKEKKNISRLDFTTGLADNFSETSLGQYVAEVSDNGSEWKQVASATAIGGRNTVDFKPVCVRYARLRVTEKAASAAEHFAEIGFRFCPEPQNLVDADAESVTFDLPSRITASSVTLPIKGSFGSDIIWSFSPEGIFEQTSEGVYKVTHASTDKTVSITATFLSGNCSAQVRRTVTVAGSGGSGGSAGGNRGTSGSGNRAYDISVPSGDIVQPVPPTAIFEDLSQAEWATEYVEALYQAGIVNGKGEKQFAPLAEVTREEFVKMLVLAVDLMPMEGNLAFEDVDGEAWYAPYLACAVQEGLVQGISDTMFGVGMPITREDMSVLAARAIAIKTGNKSLMEQTAYKDWEQIADYAKESVARLSMLGLLQGNENGEFCPRRHTSRAEAAKVLYLLQAAIKQEG